MVGARSTESKGIVYIKHRASACTEVIQNLTKFDKIILKNLHNNLNKYMVTLTSLHFARCNDNRRMLEFKLWKYHDALAFLEIRCSFPIIR